MPVAMASGWSSALVPSRLAAVTLAFVLWLGSHAAQATPYAGGAGSGFYINRELPQTVGFQWNDTPQVNITVEFWCKLIDVWQTDQYLFAYSHVDNQANTEHESEFSIGFSIATIFHLKGISRGNVAFDDYPASNVWIHKDWLHYAMTWSSTGNMTLYVDGSLVFSIRSVDLGGDWLLPFAQGGCFAFGQEADSSCGQFDRLQSSDMLFDEFRIWDYVRSAAQIKANYKLTVPPKTAGLNLYWRIDDRGSKVLKDDSVSGNNAGYMGQLPDFRNQMSFVTGEVVAPQKPMYISSTAPIFGSAYTHAYVTPTPSTTTLINLPAWSVGGNGTAQIRITSLPTMGTLTQLSGAAISVGDSVSSVGQAAAGATGMSKFVKYTTTSTTLTATDTFNFGVTDFQGSAISTVMVWPKLPLAAPRNKSYTTGEDTWLVMHAFGISETGDQLRGRIETLPSKGRIFQVGFTTIWEKYTNIVTDPNRLDEITKPGTLVINKRGIFLYLPDRDAFSKPGEVYTSFKYSLVLLNDQGTVVEASPAQGVISISVTAVNDGPAVQGLSYDADFASAAAPLIVPFTSTDVDLTFSEGAVYYRVITPPVFGTIYQVNEDGKRGQAMNTERLPEIKQYGSEMVWWSTQFSVCSWDFCVLPTTACPDTCDDHRWWAANALGPPDIYPAYLDSGKGWDPQWLDLRSDEFIDVGIKDWVYVSKVEVYETQNPGALVKLGVRSRTSSNYTTLWQGIASALPKVATISAPPLCPLPIQGAVVRVTIDDKAIPGWQTIDTVAITGTQQPPQGRVLNSKGRIAYVPTKGIHSTNLVIDSFTYAATDCLDEGASATVAIRMLPLPADVTTLAPWRVVHVDVHNSAITEVLIDLKSSLVDIIAAATAAQLKVNNTQPKLTDAAVVYKGSSAGTLAVIYDVSATGARLSPLMVEARPTKFGTFLVVLNPSDTATVRAHVWVSVGGYTWRLQVELVMLDFVPNMNLRWGMTAMAALGILVTISIGIFVFFKLKHPIIRAAQGVFLFPILLGCILSFALVFALVKPLPSIVDCVVQPWLGAWGFSLAFAPLIAKTYRLASIFNSKTIRIEHISNRQLAGMTGAIFGTLSLWVLIWCAVDPPHPVLFTTEVTSFTQCATNAGSGDSPGFWSLVLLGMMGVLTVYTAWLSFRVRKVPSQFNESRFIALVIYNLGFCGTVVIAFCLTFVTNPDVAFALISVGVMVVTYANLGLLFLPKIIRVLGKTQVQMTTNNDSTHGSMSLLSTVNAPQIDSGVSSAVSGGSAREMDAPRVTRVASVQQR